MKNPKVSIIIPVYNTEEYVKACILSIIEQTLKETEIIVINDGSTDNSLGVIQELAGTDHRIQIFSQENKGLSEARNAGMEKAAGKYIYFMDSDDLLAPEALKCCFEKCEKDRLDFIFFDAETFSDDEEMDCSVYDYLRATHVEDRVYQGKEILNLLIEKNIYKASVCLNIIRLDFLRHIGLSFYPGIIHEDELFTGLLYIQAKRTGCISEPYFKRRARSGSITTRRYSAGNINGYLNVVAQLKAFSGAESPEGTNHVTNKLIRFILDPSIYNARVLPLHERLNVFATCVRQSYLRFVSVKSLVVLLFPYAITIKSFFKINDGNR